MLSNKSAFNQKPIYLEDRPTEVKLSTCSAEKAKKLLNYQNKITLDESIDKLIDFIKSKGPKKFTYDYDLEINNDLTPKSWKEKLF